MNQDSCCPANVMCIWAGRVDVKIILSQDAATQCVSLIVQLGQQRNMAQVTLGTTIFKVILQHVLPCPGTGSDQTPMAILQDTSM